MDVIIGDPNRAKQSQHADVPLTRGTTQPRSKPSLTPRTSYVLPSPGALSNKVRIVLTKQRDYCTITFGRKHACCARLVRGDRATGDA